MTKYNFKFKALSLRGKPVEDVVSFECPDFQEETRTLPLNGKEYTFTKSVEEQLIDWLDDQDKSDLMYEKDWYAIVDYELEKPKVECSDLVFEFAKEHLSTLENGERLFTDFAVVYARLFDKLKDLSPEKQFSLVLESLNVGYDAQTEAYRHTLRVLRNEETKNLTVGFKSLENEK